MFKTRLLSGIVLVILALFLIISGHEILLFATLAISCIGMFELYRVFKMEKTVLASVANNKISWPEIIKNRARITSTIPLNSLVLNILFFLLKSAKASVSFIIRFHS